MRRLRPLAHPLIAAAAVVAIVRAEGPAGAADPPPAPASHLLGAIDFVPDRPTLDAALGPSPVAQLASIAVDDNENPGVRLRAIRALSQYPVPEAHATLVAVIGEHAAAAAGMELLYLRAGLEALGEIGTQDDVPVITPFLEATSRDVRATAAHALRAIGSPTAVPALRSREGREDQPQVRWAITEALRAILGGS